MIKCGRVPVSRRASTLKGTPTPPNPQTIESSRISIKLYYLVLLLFNGFIVCTYYGDLNYASVSCHAECGSALGIANRKIIKDEDIRASSKWRLQYDANNGRLNGNSSWCSNHTDSKPYLEIDLEKPYKITYVATQGNRNWNYWVSKYIVSHNSARSSFIEYREEEREKLFEGNIDGTSIVKHKLKKPFKARKIRFQPVAYTFGSACMRVEVYGCDLPNDCVMTGSRVLGKWRSVYAGGDIYYRAYVKTIDNYNVQLDIEDENHHDLVLKKIHRDNLVLDVPNTQLDLPSGTHVLIPYNARYFTATIGSKFHPDLFHVIPDNSKIKLKWIVKQEIRVLKHEQFCL